MRWRVQSGHPSTGRGWHDGIQRHVKGSGNRLRSISSSRTLPDRTRQLRVHPWADGIDSGCCRASFDDMKVTIRKVS